MRRSRTDQTWQKTLWIMFTAQFISAIGFSVFFPFLPLYVQELGSSTGTNLELLTGLVFSGQAVAMALIAPLWGTLADRYGRKLMVERAMFGSALVILLMAFARSAEDLVILRVMQGLITGTIAAANALVAAVTPRERMGYAMGVLQVGMWSGVAAGPLIGGLIADVFSYRAPFFLTAALLVLAGLLVWLGVQEAPVTPRPAGSARRGIVGEWTSILAAPNVALVYTLRFLASMGQTMIVPFAPLFIQMLMADQSRVGTFTGLVIGLSSITGTATAISLGRLGDRIGHRPILVACALATGLFYVPQTFVQAPWQLLLLQALSGATMGGMMPAIAALLARYTRPGEEGSVYGIDSSVMAAARAGAPLVGALFVLGFGLRGVFAATALMFIAAALLAVLRLPQTAALPAPAPQVKNV